MRCCPSVSPSGLVTQELKGAQSSNLAHSFLLLNMTSYTVFRSRG